jgi:copper resistance protein C
MRLQATTKPAERHILNTTGNASMTCHRSFIVAIASAALLLSGAATAFAHAQLRGAMPSVGGAVPATPGEVTLNFSEKLEPAFSTIVVRDSVGKRVDKGDVQIDKADRTIMRVSLESLAQGTYIVEWRALTADTHRTEGAFVFRVGE